MSEAATLFSALRQAADPDVVSAIEALVRDGPDRRLSRINALDFAAKTGLDEERVIAAFLHAARLGLFELSWNVLCPGCGGVLDAGASLKTVHQSEYACALCAAGYEPTLDEMVEVTFTVSPRVRRIAAHSPDELPASEYMRQIFWSSGIDLGDDAFARMIDEVTLDMVELPPGEKAMLSLTLPAEFVIVFEPVTHCAQFIDVKGEPTRERQSLTIVYSKTHAPNETLVMQPGPLRLALENRSDMRVVPGVYVAGQTMHDMLGQRRPFLTAKRLLTNQTFREIYRTSTLDVDQRLKITSLTFLFTDLKGSTDLYERVGDLVAFDIVKWAGAIYLAWLAIVMWRASDEPEAAVTAPHSTPRAMYRQGMLTAVLNPKVAVFQLALFPQFVDPARGSVLLQSLVLAVTQLVIVVAGDSVCVFAATGARRWFAARPGWGRWSKRALAGVFGALAARLAFQSRT